MHLNWNRTRSAVAEPRKNATIVGRAKAFLQAGLCLTEPEAHATLQKFAGSGHISVEHAADIVVRLAEAARAAKQKERAGGWPSGQTNKEI